MVDTADPDRTDTATRTSVVTPLRLRAAHVTAASDDFVEMCAEALHSEGLHHVAAYHRGVYNYSVDILESVAEDAVVDRELYIRVGRQLNFLLGRMDRALRPAESGRLIRTVLRLGGASVFHYYVRPGEYLTGVSLGAEHDESGDRAMARLAVRFAEMLRQRGPNYGGFDEDGFKGAVPAGRSNSPTTVTEALHTDRSGAVGPHPETLLTACAAALSAEDLHYVAYHDPSGHLAVDVLELAQLAPYFRNIGRDSRRDRYQDIAQRLPFVVARLNHSLKAVLPGRLTRTVLDVDEGALYYAAVGDGSFLLGVTLNQDRVFHADLRMAELTAAVERVLASG
ncbi:hypothetical protein PV682_26755 [Streptomyces niveiscabiei]|uniref:hypothetical protein n=1 Tax=Streptomyces niveiscabiei TaxID=164115 RepID=UPI0029B00C40|nr:hypothetical protein [Streptomyces niveiscabiei]MDX3385049.1 hypothetical protein [Streptomyces niveiscabiei]